MYTYAFEGAFVEEDKGIDGVVTVRRERGVFYNVSPSLENVKTFFIHACKTQNFVFQRGRYARWGKGGEGAQVGFLKYFETQDGVGFA